MWVFGGMNNKSTNMDKSGSKRNSLKSVVYKQFLKASLIPILGVEVLLIVLYFTSIYYTTEKSLDILYTNAKESLENLSFAEARNLGHQLKEVNRDALQLQKEQQDLFQHADRLLPNIDAPALAVAPNGVTYKTNQQGSSIFVSRGTKVTPSVINRIRLTEAMDSSFASISDNNPSITSAYFNSWDSFSRFYPYIDNVYDAIEPNTRVDDAPFYFEADAEHNPDRKPVWTSAYLDPAGNGWITSAIVPIYNGDFLEGVTGLDMTIQSFTRQIMSKELPWESGPFVLDDKGTVLAMSDAFKNILISDKDSNTAQQESSDASNERKHYNIFEVKDSFAPNFAELFKGEQKSGEFVIDGKKFLATQQTINETGWRLMVLTPLDNVYAPIYEQKQEYTDLGLLLVLLILNFYVVFFIYLLIASKELSNRITRPINKISQYISRFNKSDHKELDSMHVNIKELDDLLDLNVEIQIAKDKYRGMNREMKHKNKQLERLAITDQLTQVYNRLKLDEVLGYELARAKRDKNPMSVTLLDIDKFKLVNDNFGHQVGDNVLIKVSKLLLSHIRKTDILGRWGGEEFLILFPNTSLENATKQADKLRLLVAETDFGLGQPITISLGVASCGDANCERIIVEHADQALYRAKHNGRNRVEFYDPSSKQSNLLSQPISSAK
jgi:diguanylate cyclase (GGDEF)-like protein